MVTCLRDGDVQLVVATARAERARDGAALAVEEARSPREISPIDFRDLCRHEVLQSTRTPDMIVQMFETISGR